MKTEKKQICLECSKPINPKHHIVCLSTYNRFDGEKQLPDEHAWFHLQCWADYFNERVRRKAEVMNENFKKVSEQLDGIFSDKQKLNILKKKIIEKTQHGRNRKKTRSKTKSSNNKK